VDSTGRFSCGLLISLLFLSTWSWGGSGPINSSTDRGGLDRNPRAVSLGVPTDGAQDAVTMSAIDELTRRALPKQNSASLAVGIVTDGRLAWSKAYGYADIENSVPATTETIYRLASVTKQFTALMLLQLVQDGKVHLSDPVEKYLPEVNQVKGRFPGAPPITLVQLATHTSGLDREPDNTEKYLVGPVADWEKITLAALPDTKYVFEPGTRFSYSNIGYAILGVALGRAAGQPYTVYVQEHIFKPLGMTDTTFEPNQQTRMRIAKGYYFHKGQVDWKTADRELQGRGYKVPNGAAFSTVNDLAKFLAFEIGGGLAGVLKPEYFEQGFQELIATDEKLENGSALGYEIQREGSSVIFGHQGEIVGYVADVFFDRSAKTGVIVLRNAVGGDDPFDDTKFMWSVFDRLAGRNGADAAGTPPPISPQDATRITRTERHHP
jgi:CubicO group peptidase (beta-lactamase class C family)